AVTLNATSPIFLALLSPPLLGERVGRLVWAVVPLAFAGVVAIARPTFHAAPHLVLSGTSAAAFSALAMISLRKLGPGESAEAIVLHFSLFAAVVTLVLALFVWKTPDATTAFWLFATGASGGLAQVAVTRAYALERAARLGALSYFGILLSQVMAIPIFGEHPGAWQIAGAAGVVASGLL